MKTTFDRADVIVMHACCWAAAAWAFIEVML